MDMWSQAEKNSMVLQPVNHYGWTCDDNKLSVIWDTPQNMQAVRDRISVLLKGCKCITGCTSKRCSCKRKETYCSEGCECINCRNIHAQYLQDDSDDEVALEEQLSCQQLHRDTDDLMDWVFGTEFDAAEHGGDSEEEEKD